MFLCADEPCRSTKGKVFMRRALLVSVCVLWSSTLLAQPATVRVEVRADNAPVEDAGVLVNGAPHETDANGTVAVSVPVGKIEIVVVKEGFAPATASVDVSAGQEQSVIVELTKQPTVEEEMTVSATRTDARLEDLPMRVEVLAREEIEEKMMMTPGDIVMMLNEMGGMRVQATSPSLGAASVRIQGMRGRYTRFLSDGLPLFGEQVGGLGLLQIPPMDLGQVEVIKGVASALYGAGAMGGVVNLVSRVPADESVHEVLVNRSTRGATDAVFFTAVPLSKGWRLSLLGAGHWQEQTDIDDDAWSDLPEYARGVLRPRVFWDGGHGNTLFATVGSTYEDRVGGTMPGSVPAVIGSSYREALETTRLDGGAIGQVLFRDRYVLTARFAANQQWHDHQFGTVIERDRHRTMFGEVAVRGTVGRHTWVVGTAVERDEYVPRDVPQFAYRFTVPGVFLQDDMSVTDWLSVSASGRMDHHSEYGGFFSPRLSALVRSRGWTTRVSAGTGFFGPSALTEESEGAGLSRLSIPVSLVAERGRSGSVDVTRTLGPASVTLTLFASRVRNPIDVDCSTAFVQTNANQPTTNKGIELLGTIRRAPFALTGNYTFVDADEAEGDGRANVALTPRHSGGVVAMIESENIGRVGAEIYYTGRQRLEYNPYRDVSRPYASIGFLAERRFGRLRLFVNAENVTNAHQSQFDPLLRPSQGADGRWTVDAWAPLEGRVFNGGVRVEL